MGQVISAASPQVNLKKFINLSKEAIFSIWLSYNLLGEGWALTLDQFVSVLTNASYFQATQSFSDDQLCNLFNSFDTDNNGLVDALEILVAIGLLSGKRASSNCDSG
jgi:hypothetical protein